MQASFKFYDSIRIPYMEKTCWCVMAGLTCLMLVRDWKSRSVLVCLCVWGGGGWRGGGGEGWWESNIGWEVSERKYHMVAQIIKKCILGHKKFLNNQQNSERVGVSHSLWVIS